MTFQSQYERTKKELLSDNKICKENRDLFKDFFAFQEYKLKRINNLPKLDNSSYKTLLTYISRFKNINKWFKNKPLKKLTKEDIKKVYDDLEDGKIKNAYGKPFQDRRGYYNRIFKSKPFELAGKKEIAQEVIEFYKKAENNEVRFINIEDFLKIVEVTPKPIHKLLLWLSFDIGENINALLQLSKKNLVRQKNPSNKDYEYIVNLPQENIKRSRTSRSEITNFPETTKMLDVVLSGLKDNDLVFPFGYMNAKKFLDRAINKTNTKCIPRGQRVTWKDLRSSMACYLLKKGWTTDEVNARLGHKPSSSEIDKYINFLALNRHIPKKKLTDNTLVELKNELEQLKHYNKLTDDRHKRTQEELQTLKNVFHKSLKEIKNRLK